MQEKYLENKPQKVKILAILFLPAEWSPGLCMYSTSTPPLSCISSHDKFNSKTIFKATMCKYKIWSQAFL